MARQSPVDVARAGLPAAAVALARGDFDAALSAYGRILDVAPEIAEAHFGWGVSAVHVGRDREAMVSFRRALEIKPEYAEAYLRLADLLGGKGQESAALDLYRRVLKLFPDLAEAHYGCGAIALQLGRDRDAMPAFRRAFEINPKYSEAGLRWADLALAEGENALARDVYRRVLAVAPDIAEAHYGCGAAALEVGDVTAANASFHRALVLAPDYPAAYVASAFLSLFPQRGAERRVRSDRAIVCMPILPYTRDWLGGQIYLLNFARIVSSLPRHRRPRLIVAVLVEDWREVEGLRQLVEGLAACEEVLGVFARARRPISVTPTLERYARWKARTCEDPAAWTADLFASVDWTFPILYPSWGAGPVPGPLYWIPDLQHKFLPPNFSTAELMARNRDMAALAVRPVPIVFSSHDASAHFRRFYPQQRSRPYAWHFHTLLDERVAVAASKDYMALDLPDRFYYTPNQFWPHKDHVTLFKALRHVLDAGHDVTFVCTGSDLNRETTAYSHDLLRLLDELALGRNLRLVGVLPRHVQLEVMRRACAIIQPSLFEGWSTVIEDARAFGRPLIVSDLPVHREQLGKDAVFFTPQDPASLASAVRTFDEAASPGPDTDRERAIRGEQMDRIHSSARQFIDILLAENAFRS